MFTKLRETAHVLGIRRAYLTFWSWVAMLALRQIGYKGIMPVEVDGIEVLILVPKDISEWIPQGEDTHNCMGECK